nr:outer envelope protein 64, chloroplastic [Tanacetum cinerariifolium]
SSGDAYSCAYDCVGMNGVDTVGGVRQPAGHCDILGFRSSYGVVSHLGIIPIATSLDTVGKNANKWMAQSFKNDIV